MDFKTKECKERLTKMLLDGFRASDICDPLLVLEGSDEGLYAKALMQEKKVRVAAVKIKDVFAGYVELEHLGEGECAKYLTPFADNYIVDYNASFVAVVDALTVNQFCFVTKNENPCAIITLSSVEKPPMRIFLFSLVSFGEIIINDVIRSEEMKDSWQQYLSPERLAEIQDNYQKRVTVGENIELVDCLEYSDKGKIVANNQKMREVFKFKTVSEAKAAFADIDLLRLNLAKSRPIVPDGWLRIMLMCNRFEKIFNGLS